MNQLLITIEGPVAGGKTRISRIIAEAVHKAMNESVVVSEVAGPLDELETRYTIYGDTTKAPVYVKVRNG